MNLDYVNTHFASATGAYNLISAPASPQFNMAKNGYEEGQRASIMNLKPGSDNALPSPNGVIASNLLLLASYLEEPSYKMIAKRTIDAFAVEIVQHPFLFVSMLSAIVLQAAGVKTLVALGDAALYELAGFGRTLVRLQDKQKQEWLKSRNQLLNNLQPRDNEKRRVMICEAGNCRELKDGELDGRTAAELT
jgi:uncharacterized protein YyaL (SSP411 family)